MTSLSPVHSVGSQIAEALHLHRQVTPGRGAARSVRRTCCAWSASPSRPRRMRTYPFELSGGLRQRAMIAMALVCRPALLDCRRTDDGPRRHHSGPHPETLGRPPERARHGGSDDHPRPRRGRQRGRGGRSSCTTATSWNRGTLDDIFRRAAASLSDRAAARRAALRHEAEGERLKPIREIAHQRRQPTLLQRTRSPGRADADARQGPLLSACRASPRASAIRKSRSASAARPGQNVLAVDDVSFDHASRGECLGLVGESGCGKTTLSKIIMRALDGPTAAAGRASTTAAGSSTSWTCRATRSPSFRRQHPVHVFQDPFSSLNPRMTVLRHRQRAPGHSQHRRSRPAARETASSDL